MSIKKLFLSSLLIFASPCMAAHCMNVGADCKADVATGSDIPNRSPASFLSPTRILQDIQNAYLPQSLHLAHVVQAFYPQQAPSDFWDGAEKAEKALQEYVPRLLESAATYFKLNKFTEITSCMRNIVDASTGLRNEIQGTMHARQISFDTLTQELEGAFTKILDDVKKMPTPDKAPHHEERVKLVNKVLDEAMQALMEILTRHGADEKVVTKYLRVMEPYVLRLVVAVGDINEEYPQLLPILLFCVVGLLIPESWILRPFLSMFGFGPAGPVKGSAAAWIQRVFFGAAVKSGSWFSWLQAAGMGVLPKWSMLVKVPLIIGGLLALLLPCFRRK